MAELEWEGRPERPVLRRAIRHQLRQFDPTIRVIAEEYLAEVTPIDLLAVGGEGELISIRIGRGDDDAVALTRSLADLSWLRPRLADLLKLAPGLGIEPSAEPRAMLFCTDFGRETRAAVENFPARSIALLGYRCFRHQGQLSVLFDAWTPPTARSEARGYAADLASAANAPAPVVLSTDSIGSERFVQTPNPSGFRTGLVDADLHLDVEEEKILD